MLTVVIALPLRFRFLLLRRIAPAALCNLAPLLGRLVLVEFLAHALNVGLLQRASIAESV